MVGRTLDHYRILEQLGAGGMGAISTRRYVCAYEVVHAYVKLADKKQAFEWPEKGNKREPWMDPLRGDPGTRS
jgi:hypothetical protein